MKIGILNSMIVRGIHLYDGTLLHGVFVNLLSLCTFITVDTGYSLLHLLSETWCSILLSIPGE